AKHRNQLRSTLRSWLGIPDPHEPAPWMPGGDWHKTPYGTLAVGVPEQSSKPFFADTHESQMRQLGVTDGAHLGLGKSRRRGGRHSLPLLAHGDLTLGTELYPTGAAGGQQMVSLDPNSKADVAVHVTVEIKDGEVVKALAKATSKIQASGNLRPGGPGSTGSTDFGNQS
ncbi:MAG: hypothetical protein ACYC5H_19235, partial [Methylovirgula sp.]